MNRKICIILFLLTSLFLAGVPESFARPQYLTNLNEVYGEGSCGTCHVMPQENGQRNFNGTFNGTLRPNSNDTSDRRNSNRTFGSRNSNRTLLLNSYGTLFENQPDHASDPNAALMAIGQPPAATSTPTSGTKAAPGFDMVLFVFGLSAGILIARRHK